MEIGEETEEVLITQFACFYLYFYFNTAQCDKIFSKYPWSSFGRHSGNQEPGSLIITLTWEASPESNVVPLSG